MPEGDTLARIAHTLSDALAGHKVARFASPLPALRDAELEGRTITSVTTRGKHLLITFDDGRTLHTHLRMNGSWHLYPRGMPWKLPARLARVVLETSERCAVCFDAPTVRLLSKDALRRDRQLRALGPDLLAENFDAQDALRRLRKAEGTIAEALLDQRNVAGIGNEYKSELLFLAGIDPKTAIADVTDDELAALLASARDLMRKNVQTGSGNRRFRYGGRTTRFAAGSKAWVYDRAGQPCLRCKTRIECFRQGLSVRITFFCPRCQPSRKQS